MIRTVLSVAVYRAQPIRNSVRDTEKGETRRKEVNDEDSIDTGIR